jgi:hypothetical protein
LTRESLPVSGLGVDTPNRKGGSRFSGIAHPTLIRFPAGYVEPCHNHASSHSVLVLEGVQIAEGEPLHPGDYLIAVVSTR